jgi:hypothetical protein
MVDDHADKLAGGFLGTAVGDVTDARIPSRRNQM